MATSFEVVGPLEIPFYKGAGGRSITEENIRDFWLENPHFAERRGCYVFGVRAGGGFSPGYVGKAGRTFRQECFAPHKLAKYQQFLADYGKGTPVLFLLAAEVKKGAPPLNHIQDLESFLIQLGVVANPDLLNVRGTKQAEWSIRGVLRSQGKPSKAALQFRRMMKFAIPKRDDDDDSVDKPEASPPIALVQGEKSGGVG